MESKDIIKALECCKNNEKEETYKYCSECFCGGCELNESEDNCYDVLFGRTIELIKNQQAEIERLIHNLEAMAVTMRNSANATKIEAYKEFADRLKENTSTLYSAVGIREEVDNLLKELTERKEDDGK